MQNSNNLQTAQRFQLPRRCTNERITAARQTMRRLDIRPVKPQCTELFKEYVTKSYSKQLVFVPNPEKNLFGPPLVLPYKTRFSDMGRKVENLKKYEHCWNVASKNHNVGVLVTLTFDPKLQESLWDCNKSAAGKLNKLFSYLTRKKGTRPEYINVFEYQKNGRIHFHVMIFGHKWVMGKTALSELWKKYGAGEIVDFLSVQNDGEGWRWTRQKPKDANGKDPIEYLKKYLKKGLFDINKLYQYWIYNNRFFSYSRKLSMIISYKTSKNLYIFAGTITHEPDYLDELDIIFCEIDPEHYPDG